MASTSPTVVIKQPLNSGQKIGRRGTNDGAVVEALRFEDQRRSGDQRKVKPGDFVEKVGRDGGQIQPATISGSARRT